jgi:putative heme-binding domain-containing protein
VKPPVEGTDGPHATPNSPLIVPHVAVRNLVALNAVDAAVNAVGTPNSDGALWALRYLHDEKAVDGLIKKFATVTDAALGDKILGTLIRLYQQETPYDGSYWWSTRPDSRGPYYKPMQWTASSKIAAFVKAEHEKANAERKALIEMQCRRNRAAIPGLNIVIAEPGDKKKNEPKVDLAKIAQQAGELGKISIEDVMLALDKMKGDPKVGEKLFTRQGCVACHTLKATDPMKGPFMGQVGSILKKEQIAESILKPNASISQGFATVQIETKDKAVHVGFVSGQTADSIEMRDITGRVWSVKSADVSTRKELEVSMMPEGLVNALSLQEFVSLVSFLESQKK